MSDSFAPHQQRVVDEHRELWVRLNKLNVFFNSPVFDDLDEAEKTRLIAQQEFMNGYERMLRERINCFVKQGPPATGK